MRPSQAVSALEDLGSSFRGSLYRKGIRLSRKDRATVIEVYQQWMLLAIDLGYLRCETLQRDACRLFTTMVKVDVLSLNNAFAELLHLVRCQQNKGFKALCHIVSPHLYNLVKGDCNMMLKGDVYAGKRLIQLFSYTGRLSLQDIDLTQQCLTDYLDTEANILSSYPEPVLLELNKIVRRWMKFFDPDRIHPGHGPGGVAGHGRCCLEVKYKDLTTDHLLSYAFGDPWWAPGPVRSTLDRISHTIFVAKSYKTFRTISMEPSSLMYFQQGVWREIDRVVASSSELRSHIGFHDQERNKQLAKEGSFSRNYATLDLSAASDSVSYALVKKIFRGTKLLRFLVTTRSRRTLLPDGNLVELKKFAPMGSALCFPIETIIFAAVCQHVTRIHGVAGDFSVFGDDIIVPTQCAEFTMQLLGRLGFRVNREKSFYSESCWFRESCGGEYLNGFDVSPIRVSRKYTSDTRLVYGARLVKLANTAYSYNFRYLRSFFLSKIRKIGYKAVFSPSALLGDNYTNFHLERKWNKALQREEFEATGLKLETDFVPDEQVRYRHWLESTAERSSIGLGFVSNTSPATVKPVDRWYCAATEAMDWSSLLGEL